jgi:oxygen-independent coproporphyrinogen-3 oxidase
MPGVYISWPFCAQKCTYCNFASGVFPRELERRYLAALRDEIAAHEWKWTPETLYLGGGTPGSMDTADLAALTTLVPGRPWKEATIEAAPGSISEPQARAWIDAGINRVSLGVQSFVEAELRRSGRRHGADSVARDVRLLRGCGIEEINIDLIAGLPGQTAASWRESLEWIERLAPPHVSVYMLEVDEDSRLGLEILSGGLRYGAGAVPGDDEIADFYEHAEERLAALGLRRYEISNFARPGHESLHNLKYWKLEPYVGFGAGAHSFDGALRRANRETPAEYVDEGALLESAPASLREERFFVGLRLMEGIVPAPEEEEFWREPVERLIRAGLLERAGGRLRLTRRGVLLSNEVFEEFVIPCPTA